MNLANDARRVAGELRSCIDIGGIGNIDQVMRDAAARVERKLIRPDVEAAVDGGRIAADHLAAVPLRQREAERALA